MIIFLAIFVLVRTLSAPLVCKYYCIITAGKKKKKLYCHSDVIGLTPHYFADLYPNGASLAIFKSIKVGPSLKPTDGEAFLRLRLRESMFEDVMLENSL